MKESKKNRALGITAPYTKECLSNKDDLSALQELETEIDRVALEEYILTSRKIEAVQRDQYKEEEKEQPNPFDDLPAKRLWELIDHEHHSISYGAKIALARKDFFYFCHLKAPTFYKLDRKFLIQICRDFQAFYESPDERVMILEAPPRHGKSRTASLFEQWVFGKNRSEQIMTGSYNKDLSTTFSKTVRDGIDEEKGDPDIIVYSDIFHGIRIQYGEAAMNRWSLEGQYSSYLATSPDATATGFGATLLIVDDLIKKAQEAFNETVLEAHWKWFVDTLLSRLEAGGKIIIIMTRWASGDLAGRAKEHFKKDGIPCRVTSLKALVDKKKRKMLCEEILPYSDYIMKTSAMSKEIASANYQQIPIDLKGRLYQSFKTYNDIPRDENGKSLFTAIRAYCDTADEGDDYLCNIIYGVYLHCAYVLDVYYTKEAMEITEKETARRLCEFKVGDANIESNNGGRGFARNVQRILKDIFKFFRCAVNWFHQGENKRARILTNATFVQNNILFPADWQSRWPEYYEAMFKYQKEGKNAHDDAPDATTGVAEHFDKSSVVITLLGKDENAANVDEQSNDTGSFISTVKKAFGRLSDRRPDKWF